MKKRDGNRWCGGRLYGLREGAVPIVTGLWLMIRDL